MMTTNIPSILQSMFNCSPLHKPPHHYHGVYQYYFKEGKGRTNKTISEIISERGSSFAIFISVQNSTSLYWVILIAKCAAHTLSVMTLIQMKNGSMLSEVSAKSINMLLPNEVFLCNSLWKPLKFCDEDINVNSDDIIHIS